MEGEESGGEGGEGKRGEMEGRGRSIMHTITIPPERFAVKH